MEETTASRPPGIRASLAGSALFRWLVPGISQPPSHPVSDAGRTVALCTVTALLAAGVAAVAGVSAHVVVLTASIAAQSVAGALLLISPISIARVTSSVLVVALAFGVARSAADEWLDALYASGPYPHTIERDSGLSR